MDAAANSPAFLYVALILSILVAVAGAVPKILGPLGQTYDEWQSKRRAAASDAEDEAVRDREQRIAYWQGVADAHLREIQERDVLISYHRAWDNEAAERAAERGVVLEPAPPLLPKLKESTIGGRGQN